MKGDDAGEGPNTAGEAEGMTSLDGRKPPVVKSTQTEYCPMPTVGRIMRYEDSCSRIMCDLDQPARLCLKLESH